MTLRQCRILAGYSQYVVAKALGVSFQSVSRWELGQCRPTDENFKKLSILFGVDMDTIKNLEGLKCQYIKKRDRK